MPEEKIASEKGLIAVERKGLKAAERPATILCLALIRFYRLFISPLKPQVCRFYPSCSQYTYEAVSKYGFCRGFFMGLKRVLHCHPFHPGGYDPLE